jgi:hypothetical protein
MLIGTFTSIGTSMSTVTSTTGPRLIAPDTAAATGLATGAVIVPAAADTEVAAGIGAEAAAATADRPDRDLSRRKAFLIVARQAAGL